MLLGAHLPTAKGFSHALRHAQTLGCSCLQIFTKSPQQWNAKPLDLDKAALFRDEWRASGLSPLVAHDSFLINLASPNHEVLAKSVAAMLDEIERADLLGCDFLVTHCGAHLQKDCANGADKGLDQLAQSLIRVLEATPNARVRILLENTAAQGTCLGGPFEHLSRVLEKVNSPRLGVCFDTCHAHAAGHDLGSPENVEYVLQDFDTIVGLEKLCVIHLNDSKGVTGKHLDRHEHIGLGTIGRDAMRALVNHPLLRDKPLILETPEVETMIEENLMTVRELRGGDTKNARMRVTSSTRTSQKNVTEGLFG